LAIAGLLFSLTACGGSGSDGQSVSSPAGSTLGVAVDPYIAGAYFQEISENGVVLQETPAPSDINGQFSFIRALTPGSTVAMKIGGLVLHNGVVYQGMLKRKVAGTGTNALVVSPLTTLLAADLSPSQVLDVLRASGINGLVETDLTEDPMLRAANTSELQLLQANMAVNAFIDKIMDEARSEQGFNQQTFDARLTAIETADNTLLMGTLAEAMGDCLDPSRRQGRSLDEVIREATEINRMICTLIRENRGSDMQAITLLIRDAVQQELGEVQPDPQPDPNGQDVYDGNCSDCHAMGDYDTNGSPDLAEKAALMEAKLSGGHKGLSLTDAQLAALIEWSAGIQAPTPDPAPQPAPVNGEGLFSSDCNTCHNHSGNGGLYDLSGDGSLVLDKFTADVASHQNKVFSAGQIQAIADFVDTFTPPPAPDP